MGSRERDSKRLPFANQMPGVVWFCVTTGHIYRCLGTLQPYIQIPGLSISSAGAFLANRSALQLEGVITSGICGRNSFASSPKRVRVGLLLRMSLASELEALSGCPLTWSEKILPSGRSIWMLRYRKGNVDESAWSGLPTPTAKANHGAPSMKKWPAYRGYHDRLKPGPELWEWMMGFPAAWTGCISWAIPFLRTSRKRSEK